MIKVAKSVFVVGFRIFQGFEQFSIWNPIDVGSKEFFSEGVLAKEPLKSESMMGAKTNKTRSADHRRYTILNNSLQICGLLKRSNYTQQEQLLTCSFPLSQVRLKSVNLQNVLWTQTSIISSKPSELDEAITRDWLQIWQACVVTFVFTFGKILHNKRFLG